MSDSGCQSLVSLFSLWNVIASWDTPLSLHHLGISQEQRAASAEHTACCPWCHTTTQPTALSAACQNSMGKLLQRKHRSNSPPPQKFPKSSSHVVKMDSDQVERSIKTILHFANFEKDCSACKKNQKNAPFLILRGTKWDQKVEVLTYNNTQKAQLLLTDWCKPSLPLSIPHLASPLMHYQRRVAQRHLVRVSPHALTTRFLHTA